MVEIKYNLVDGKMWSIKCPFSMKPKYVVIHNTSNDAPAANEVAYMRRNYNEVSFHYAVDDKEIVQGILEDRNAWHAGDGGSGEGNRYGIAIEICYSESGGEKFEKAERNAAELAASILKRYGWGIDRLKKHQDFNGKYCPHRTLDLGWQRFVNMVKAFLEPPVVVEPIKPVEDPALPKYVVGKIYRTNVDKLNVRVGAGTNNRRKAYEELTKSGKAHAYNTGRLKKGTAVRCLETKVVSGNVWMRIPSGWCAAYYKGKYYIK